MWRPTLAMAPSAARHARAVVETAFSSRRHRFVKDVARRGVPSVAALRSGEREAAAAIVVGSGGVPFETILAAAAAAAASEGRHPGREEDLTVAG